MFFWERLYQLNFQINKENQTKPNKNKNPNCDHSENKTAEVSWLSAQDGEGS